MKILVCLEEMSCHGTCSCIEVGLILLVQSTDPVGSETHVERPAFNAAQCLDHGYVCVCKHVRERKHDLSQL